MNYLTVREICTLYARKPATVRWYAHFHRWRRAEDHKRPALYFAADVEATFARSRKAGPSEPACSCPRPPAVVVVDANGWRRWCGECGGALWLAAPDPGESQQGA